ncbi:hypothetical protein [Aquisphaera insulae]|uniref:hypothetical protein n=1 Tax=Aquisphaera insulae TaxID=2712864 RepID=UPI0013EC6621|nr:hypothetical protein [Aquisphaera insulae]
MSIKPSRGVVHGRTIEIVEDPGLTEGQEVEDDQILAEIEEARRKPSTREIPE